MHNTRKISTSLPPRQTTLTTLFIFLTYLWTSSAYLSWTNHLSALASNTVTYLATEAGGCITQVFGILLFAYLLRHDTASALKSKTIIFLMAIDGLCILPIVFSGEVETVLMWGLIMNLFHGAIAAYYIARLSYYLPKNRRAISFGAGYALGSISTYPLSKAGGGNFLGTRSVWLVFAFLILICCFLAVYMDHGTHGLQALTTSPATQNEHLHASQIPRGKISPSTCALTGAVIIFLGLTVQLSFFFPAKAYIQNTAILEYSHMYYAIGLVIAAIINDRKRNAGLILALFSLCFPILSLSLYQLSYLLTALAIIGKSIAGFFTVYRIVVFADLYDDDKDLLFLAPTGLLCGRIGEAAGAALGYGIDSRHILLTAITTLLFIITIFLSFVLYIRLYGSMPATTLQDRANHFYAKYALSIREQQVLPLLIAGKTNQEIAKELFISENTVKFHVKNILKKTDCQKRTDIIRKFQSYS